MAMRTALVAMVVVVMAASVAMGATKVISVNYTDSTNLMAPGDVAGFVPAANWNNVTGLNGVGIGLNDDGGNPTGVTLDFQHDAAGYINNTSTSGSLGDNLMMNSGGRTIGGGYGELYSQTLLSGLNAEFPNGYDVYVYFGDANYNFMWGNGVLYESTAADYTLDIHQPNAGAPLANVTDSQTYNTPEGLVFNGTWTAGQNYVAFTGKSLDAVCYTAWETGGGTFWVSEVNGIQIVGEDAGGGGDAPIAEPTGLGLVGLALTALRRRRS
jgi:MYXO-CTERM domain-containing protein